MSDKNSLDEMFAIGYNTDFELSELFDYDLLFLLLIRHEYHIYFRTRSFS